MEARVKRWLPRLLLSSKGQITVPVAIRKRLGVKAGDRLQFVVEEGDVRLRPARSDENPFERYIGALSLQRQADGAAVAWVRSMRDEDEHE